MVCVRLRAEITTGFTLDFSSEGSNGSEKLAVMVIIVGVSGSCDESTERRATYVQRRGSLVRFRRMWSRTKPAVQIGTFHNS